MKILLVEDDIEISTMLKNFLITENFEVITALDGESACEKFFSDNFSLVLLDLMIPKMNGIEVMSKIREHNTVPIIIISAKDTDSDKTLGLGLGADAFARSIIYTLFNFIFNTDVLPCIHKFAYLGFLPYQGSFVSSKLVVN